MKSLVPLTTLFTIVLSQALPPPSGPWTAGAWNPLVGWVGEGINANGDAFWIGKETAAYCPSDVEGLDCSAFPGDQTVFIGGNDTLSLDVAVPGGQQVYVSPTGALGYTPPHSTSMPSGSVTTGFLRFQSEAGGAPVPIDFENNSFVACPTTANSTVYQVFARAIYGNGGDDCVLFEMRTYTASGVNAWEYE